MYLASTITATFFENDGDFNSYLYVTLVPQGNDPIRTDKAKLIVRQVSSNPDVPEVTLEVVEDAEDAISLLGAAPHMAHSVIVSGLQNLIASNARKNS